MNCEHVKAYLNEYVDGFLPEKTREQVEAHLLHCADCRAEADALLLLREDIRALKIEDTSDFVFDIARAKTPVVLPLWKRRWVQALSTAAACVVLFVGVLAVTQNGYQMPPDTETGTVEHAARDRDIENKTQDDARLRTAEVPMEETEFHVPYGADKYTYYSAYSEKEQNQKASEPITYDAVQTESAAMAASEAEEDLKATADAEQAPAAGGSAAGAVPPPASGGAGGATAVVYEKRTVTLAVAPEAREAFLNLLAGVQLAGYGEEIVVDEAAMEVLLSAEGVTFVSDATQAAESDLYQGKIVLVY